MLDSKNKILPLPGALVISTYAPCPDIRSVVTPDLKCPPSRPASSLLWVSLAPGMYRVGGSALSQVCMCVVFYACLSSHMRHIYIGARRCLVQSTVPKPVKVITDVSYFHRHPINEDQKHQQSETRLWMFIMRVHLRQFQSLAGIRIHERNKRCRQFLDKDSIKREGIFLKKQSTQFVNIKL